MADCTDKECGDDGCGGSCGDCAEGESCEESVCLSAMQPDVVAADIAAADSSGNDDALFVDVADGSDGADVSGEEPKKKSGGCSAGTPGDATSLLLFALATLVMLVWRRRLVA